MMLCNSKTKRPNGAEYLCALELGHDGPCAWVPPTHRVAGSDGVVVDAGLWRLLTIVVAFVAGVLLANFCGGCGRVNYELRDDAGDSSSSSALLGTWQRSDGACELSMSFADDGVVTLERACDDGCTFHLQGGYEVAGDELVVDLSIDGESAQPSAPLRVDELELELGGATWQRVAGAGELAGVCQ
jgi:hypothetical protein